MAKNDMLFIPAGEFEMGISRETADSLFHDFFHSDADANPYIFYSEVPAREVSIPAFRISKYEVTNSEFSEFVKDDGYSRKEFWKELLADDNLNTDLVGTDRLAIFVDRTQQPGPSGWSNGKFPLGKENHPVEGICWFEAAAYCRWKKVRLPSESEWEYAARGSDGRLFPWGNQFDVINNWTDQQAGKTTPVGSIFEDESPFGLFDMSRNVSEWVDDTWNAYPNAPMAHPEVNNGKYGVVRGGGYLSVAYQMRTTFRTRVSRLERRGGIGFRTAQ
jgi:formylglycine-generating enzyme required for sulfatase activity